MGFAGEVYLRVMPDFKLILIVKNTEKLYKDYASYLSLGYKGNILAILHKDSCHPEVLFA